MDHAAAPEVVRWSGRHPLYHRPITRIQRLPFAGRARSIVDLVYVVAPQNQGWILEGLCSDIESAHHGSSSYFYCDGRPPRARAYFFSHYSLFERYADDRHVRDARSIVLLTHPSHPPLTSPRGAPVLARADIVVSMSTMFAAELRAAGVPSDRVRVLIPGVDPDVFLPHSRLNGAVGFSSAYYERKNPELILEIARQRPDLAFRLLGRGWEDWPRFGEIVSTPNLEHVELDLIRYPDFYRSIDVFVSPSTLEGGPIPLLEAMMSNVVPVATRTGFAPDIIHHGVNGFVCEVGSEAGTFAELIDAAFGLTTDVRSSVIHLTSATFARGIVDLL